MSKITNDSLTQSGKRCFVAYGNSGRQRVRGKLTNSRNTLECDSRTDHGHSLSVEFLLVVASVWIDLVEVVKVDRVGRYVMHLDAR